MFKKLLEYPLFVFGFLTRKVDVIVIYENKTTEGCF